MIGSNFADDTKNGFFLTVNDQIDIACKKIAADPKLQNGFAYVTFFGINFFYFSLSVITYSMLSFRYIQICKY
jgi:hypothetical protein